MHEQMHVHRVVARLKAQVPGLVEMIYGRPLRAEMIYGRPLRAIVEKATHVPHAHRRDDNWGESQK